MIYLFIYVEIFLHFKFKQEWKCNWNKSIFIAYIYIHEQLLQLMRRSHLNSNDYTCLEQSWQATLFQLLYLPSRRRRARFYTGNHWSSFITTKTARWIDWRCMEAWNDRTLLYIHYIFWHRMINGFTVSW